MNFAAAKEMSLDPFARHAVGEYERLARTHQLGIAPHHFEISTDIGGQIGKAMPVGTPGKMGYLFLGFELDDDGRSIMRDLERHAPLIVQQEPRSKSAIRRIRATSSSIPSPVMQLVNTNGLPGRISSQQPKR